MTTDVDADALSRAVVIARKGPAEAKRIDARLAKGDDWSAVARSAAYFCQITSLHLMPWENAPMHGHITEPRVDKRAADLLRRLLAAGRSRYEPDPIAALAEAEKRQTAK